MQDVEAMLATCEMARDALQRRMRHHLGSGATMRVKQLLPVYEAWGCRQLHLEMLRQTIRDGEPRFMDWSEYAAAWDALIRPLGRDYACFISRDGVLAAIREM